MQGVIVLPLFMEQRIKIVTRDACDNERDAGGLVRGFGLKTGYGSLGSLFAALARDVCLLPSVAANSGGRRAFLRVALNRHG